MRYLLLFFILSGCFFQNSNKNRIVEGNYCDSLDGCEKEKFLVCQKSLMNKKFKVISISKYAPINIIEMVIMSEKVIFSNALSNSDDNIKVFETGYDVIHKKNKKGKRIEYIKLKKVWNDANFPEDRLTPEVISIRKYNEFDLNEVNFCDIWVRFYEKNHLDDFDKLGTIPNLTGYSLQE